jgi:putative Mg2+ transporter-C (MgtC) family protein
MNELFNVSFVEEWRRLVPVLMPFLVRCGIAAVCGGLIGLEREFKQKPAGFRTNILICVGSAMYMAIGLLLLGPQYTAGGFDPGRIAAQVVTGIGFLGAGTIIQQGAHVTGLTTAATIWVVAAIGLVAGAGFPILAAISALLVLATLTVLGPIERRLFHRNRESGVVNRE